MKKTLRYKNFKSNFQGITLIALIITIVILLIITAVSVDVVVDTGLFDTSKKTLDDAKQSITNTQNQTNDLISEWNTIYGGIQDGTYVPEILIEYDGNGATSGRVTQQIAIVGTPLAIQNNKFEKTGYAFTGWNTSADGTGTSYTEGETYTFENGLVLYAQWIEISEAPVISSISLRSRSTDYIYVYAKATDEDTKKLDYNLYMRAEGEEYTLTPAYTYNYNEGSTVTLKAEDLTEYTVYYYYVTVSDGATTLKSEEFVSGTGCSGTGITETCSDAIYCTSGSVKVCGTYRIGGVASFTCPVHGSSTSSGCCSQISPASYYTVCSGCGGRGPTTTSTSSSQGQHAIYNPCSHGAVTSHYYCSTHEINIGSSQTHNYTHCIHGETSKHYPN